MNRLHTKLHSSGPHDPVRRHIAGAMANARRVDAAVAFVTRAGVDLAHREIDTSRCDVRIVTSVRWPTNIKAVAELATRWPNAIWIHLAGHYPQEKSGDKDQSIRRRPLSKARVTRLRRSLVVTIGRSQPLTA